MMTLTRSPFSFVTPHLDFQGKTLSMKPNRTILLRVFLPVVALLTAHNILGYDASDGQQMFIEGGPTPTSASIGFNARPEVTFRIAGVKP